MTVNKSVASIMIKSQSNKHYYWAIMPDLYIATALLLADELLLYAPQYGQTTLASSEIARKVNLSSFHPNCELILPLIHNFKHGIELYIKSLGIIDYGQYQKEHDLKKLLETLKREARKTENQRTVNKLYNDVWGTVSKYYYGRYIPSKKGSNCPDKQNEAERYPEYKRKKSHIYRIPTGVEWVTRQVLQDIKNDIKKIETEFNKAQHKIKPTEKFIYERTRQRKIQN